MGRVQRECQAAGTAEGNAAPTKHVGDSCSFGAWLEGWKEEERLQQKENPFMEVVSGAISGSDSSHIAARIGPLMSHSGMYALLLNHAHRWLMLQQVPIL